MFGLDKLANKDYTIKTLETTLDVLLEKDEGKAQAA